MKIVTVTPTVSPGGLYRVAIEETREFIKQGFDSKLISLFRPINPWDELLKDIPMEYLAQANFLSPFISELINRNLFLLKKITGSFDVAICHNMPAVYAVNTSYDNLKKISYIHDPIHFTVSGNIYHLFFNSSATLETKYSRNWLKESELILVNSKRSQRALKDRIQLESKVLYPTLIHSYNQILSESREGFFLCVGRIGYHPTYPRLLEIMKRVKHMQLVIAGAWSHSASKIINMFLEDPFVKDRIRFVVSPTDQELASLYGRARAFIYPGIENFNMSAMEAASHGCPIIVSKESGICEILDDYRLVAASDDTESFVNMVEDLIADEKKAIYEGKQVLRYTARYDSEYHMSTLTKLIEEIA